MLLYDTVCKLMGCCEKTRAVVDVVVAVVVAAVGVIIIVDTVIIQITR